MSSKLFLQALSDHFGSDNLLSKPEECWAYGYDNSRLHALPHAIAFATTHEQVVAAVKLCNHYKIPLVARGRGTGTTGGSVPLAGGLVLALERMNRIMNLDVANRTITVEPGITNQEVQKASAEHRFFWPPDPSSAAYCTIGGNLSFNSAGPRAVKYGTPRENTLSLRAVTGRGETIRTGVQTTKGVVGYDLTRLLIGSEGTLAIITEATLKLTPLAEAKTTFQAIYANVHAASEAISQLMAQPHTPCALEFLDRKAIDMIRNYSKISLPENAGALLIIEVDGAKTAMPEIQTAISAAAKNSGLMQFHIAQNADEARLLWETRKALSPALRTIAPKKINEDVVVPVSQLPQLISGLENLAEKYQIIIVNFGHAGNGNIHVNLLINPDDATQLKNSHACLDEVFNLVLKLNGTLSGEHGVGISKRDFISREIDSVSLQLMRELKQVFDPNMILNPGKIF